VDGKIISASGKILTTGALQAVGGTSVIDSFASKLERSLRLSIKRGHWAMSNPAQWRKNVLSWRNPATNKPYFANEGEAENFEYYFLREMDTLPITFIIADPAVSDEHRNNAWTSTGGKITFWAFYAPEYATYIVNLATTQGWETLKPRVQTSQSGRALRGGPDLTGVVNSLKQAIAAGAPEVHAPRHEFGHADERIASHFVQVLAGSEAAQSDPEQAAAQLTQARLGSFKRAVSSYSSDLIRAKSDQDVTNAMLKRHPTLVKDNPAYLEYVIEYAAVLVSLGLIGADHLLFPIGSGDLLKLAPVPASSPTMQRFQLVNGTASLEVPGATVNDVGIKIMNTLSKGASEPFEPEHILDSLKMVQQNMDPSATDVSAAMSSLQQTGAVGQEELRRVRALQGMAGPNFLSTVQTVAAADALPQNSLSA
jgi:hypothetical protein